MCHRQRRLHHKHEDNPNEKRCISQNLVFRQQYDCLHGDKRRPDVPILQDGKRNLGCSQGDVFKQ